MTSSGVPLGAIKAYQATHATADARQRRGGYRAGGSAAAPGVRAWNSADLTAGGPPERRSTIPGVVVVGERVNASPRVAVRRRLYRGSKIRAARLAARAPAPAEPDLQFFAHQQVYGIGTAVPGPCPVHEGRVAGGNDGRRLGEFEGNKCAFVGSDHIGSIEGPVLPLACHMRHHQGHITGFSPAGIGHRERIDGRLKVPRPRFQTTNRAEC